MLIWGKRSSFCLWPLTLCLMANVIFDLSPVHLTCKSSEPAVPRILPAAFFLFFFLPFLFPSLSPPLPSIPPPLPSPSLSPLFPSPPLSFFLTKSFYVAQAGFILLILLPQLPVGLNYKYSILGLAS